MSKAPTDTEIQVTLPEMGKAEWRDRDTPNLLLRGNKQRGIWYFRHRIDGKRIYHKLGRWPDLTLAAARKAVKAEVEGASVCVATGERSPPKKHSKRAAQAREASNLSMGEALDRYRIAHLSSLRSGAHAESVLRRVYAGVMDERLADLTSSDLLNCINARRATSPSAAEQAIRYAKPFFRWIAKKEYGEDLLSTVKVQQTRERQRVLSLSEIGHILYALDQMGSASPALAIITFIATVGRLSDVACMQADEIDVDTWTWTPPAEGNNGGRIQQIPINRVAKHALARAVNSPDYKAGLLFPGRTDGPYKGWSGFKRRLDSASGVTDWVFHDVRRSFASICIGCGVDPVVVERCLHPAALGSRSRYMNAVPCGEMLTQRRQALEVWSDALLEAFDEAQSAFYNSSPPLKPTDLRAALVATKNHLAVTSTSEKDVKEIGAHDFFRLRLGNYEAWDMRSRDYLLDKSRLESIEEDRKERARHAGKAKRPQNRHKRKDEAIQAAREKHARNPRLTASAIGAQVVSGMKGDPASIPAAETVARWWRSESARRNSKKD